MSQLPLPVPTTDRVIDSTMALARRGGWTGEARRCGCWYLVAPEQMEEIRRAAGLSGRQVPRLRGWEEESDAEA